MRRSFVTRRRSGGVSSSLWRLWAFGAGATSSGAHWWRFGVIRFSSSSSDSSAAAVRTREERPRICTRSTTLWREGLTTSSGAAPTLTINPGGVALSAYLLHQHTAPIKAAEPDAHIFVINGFYMAMREKYTKPGESISYYLVEWDPKKLSWEDFRGKVLGATDPATAEADAKAKAAVNSIGK